MTLESFLPIAAIAIWHRNDKQSAAICLAVWMVSKWLWGA
jgi:hypothetical protein